ncbi:aspartate/glutamate racemase family protein [Methylobacterium sp. 77]|uniref:glutamate racemase n=1 Tax=Methylobacterium sp. 77 TaxID=1101192 RepID=UPI00037EAB00|nr:aspartate/glutamate racemase family protein [Methylobacterium sp. 77]
MRAIVDDATRHALHRPVAVFDAGIGSYAAVTLIRRLLPKQDIVYFADRASFPYGEKSRPELLGILQRTLRFLDGFSPAAVLVASNAPSVTVLDDLAGVIGPPVFGVRPPIRNALALAGERDVAVLGVRSMVESEALRAYADAEAQGRGAQVHLVDASSLVALVESGDFLFSAEKTRDIVDGFMRDLDARHPEVGVLTLSSTHLPWLRSYLDTACGHRPLLDPLEDAVAAIAPHAVPGSGMILGLVTEDERYGIEDFRRMLGRLDIILPLHAVLA